MHSPDWRTTLGTTCNGNSPSPPAPLGLAARPRHRNNDPDNASQSWIPLPVPPATRAGSATGVNVVRSDESENDRASVVHYRTPNCESVSSKRVATPNALRAPARMHNLCIASRRRGAPAPLRFRDPVNHDRANASPLRVSRSESPRQSPSRARTECIIYASKSPLRCPASEHPGSAPTHEARGRGGDQS